MDEDVLSLDLEFKRYLQILRPYLAQLRDKNTISVCNAWIQRLSDCDDREKVMRNKYVFSLCYQLAKGTLEEPFSCYPPNGQLKPVSESIKSEDSSTEIECLVVDGDDLTHTEVLYDKKTIPSEVDFQFQMNEFENTKTESRDYTSDIKSTTTASPKTVVCYACPKMFNKHSCNIYEKNVISKLREIKNQNMLLRNELAALKEESNTKYDFLDDIVKVDNATSAFIHSNESSATLKSLKSQLQEVQESRNSLIDKIAGLQEQLDNFNEIKKHEIENIEARHKLEIIHLKTAVRDETKDIYEKKIEELKKDYETNIKEIENRSTNEIKESKIVKNIELEEAKKVIASKDIEINQLKNQIQDLKTYLHSVLEKFIEKPGDGSNHDTNKLRAVQLEKRLNRMEKNKIRCTREYEAKLSKIQREKHLAECSLQLQMVRQRAQVINESTDENQTELTSALDKLETKYKEIVANVQATAIQRRMQDQLALESILQAVCGIPNENNPQSANQFSKTIRNQNRSYDNEISPLFQCNKDNVTGGHKSFGEDSLAGYCLNSERMGELFEKVYIPQRDNSETK